MYKDEIRETIDRLVEKYGAGILPKILALIKSL